MHVKYGNVPDKRLWDPDQHRLDMVHSFYQCWSLQPKKTTPRCSTEWIIQWCSIKAFKLFRAETALPVHLKVPPLMGRISGRSKVQGSGELFCDPLVFETLFQFSSSSLLSTTQLTPPHPHSLLVQRPNSHPNTQSSLFFRTSCVYWSAIEYRSWKQPSLFA